MSKYYNKKVIIDGILFASTKEGQRYKELKLLLAAGEIADLELQPEYELIPPQYDADIVTKTGKVKRGRCLEKACTYKADFRYKDRSGQEIVEDVKGIKVKEYRIKKKLMLWRYGIRITEV